LISNNTNSSPRMLVLGLDAADPGLIEKWSDEGILPTLRFLRRQGVWMPFQHDGPLPSAAVWPSIYTGTHPGRHGIYNGLQLEPGQQTIDLVKPSECGQPPFWGILDKNGKRSIIMDVPFNYPLEGFSGVQILDWGTYERHYKSHSLPDEVLTKMSRRFGAYPFGDEMSRNVPSSVRDFQRVRSQLFAGVALKGSVIKWLMSDGPWDFLMAIFSETHAAGHYFWMNGQRKSPSAPPAEFTTTIREIYKAVDEEIGKIITGIDGNTTLLVLSGQGMGPNDANWHLVPEVLARLGQLVTKSKRDGSRMAQANWLGEIRDMIPLAWRRSVSRFLPGSCRDHLRLYWFNSSIDWSQTRAFHLPTDLFGYIRINLKGREPHGIVEPGSEYNDLCRRIGEAFKELVNPHTGKRIVREVFHADQWFPGPQRKRLPDLIIAWEDEPPVGGAYSNEIGRVNGKSPDPRSGNHKPHGFAIFYGPGFAHEKVVEGRIVDIAPTVLKYFGLKPPPHSDGRPLTEVFPSCC
jgi:predicted AlkP superfamily phosphohydrolase/phosphomutase